MNIHLILYDVSTDTIRTKIAKRLIAEGYERIQLSVLIGHPHPKKIIGLWSTLQQWLQAEPTAKFYVIKLPANSLKQMTMIGEKNIDIDFLLGTKNSIFI